MERVTGIEPALSAWELDRHASLTGTLHVSHHLRLSVSDRQTPVLTPLSGTQRARYWGTYSRETIWMQTTGALLLGWLKCSVPLMLRVAYVSDRQDRLLYLALYSRACYCCSPPSSSSTSAMLAAVFTRDSHLYVPGGRSRASWIAASLYLARSSGVTLGVMATSVAPNAANRCLTRGDGAWTPSIRGNLGLLTWSG